MQKQTNLDAPEYNTDPALKHLPRRPGFLRRPPILEPLVIPLYNAWVLVSSSVTKISSGIKDLSAHFSTKASVNTTQLDSRIEVRDWEVEKIIYPLSAINHLSLITTPRLKEDKQLIDKDVLGRLYWIAQKLKHHGSVEEKRIAELFMTHFNPDGSRRTQVNDCQLNFEKK